MVGGPGGVNIVEEYTARVRVQMSVEQLPLTQYNKQHSAAQVLDPKMRVLMEWTTDRGPTSYRDWDGQSR